MNTKYNIYRDEILSLWNAGKGYTDIARIIIKKHNLQVKDRYLRRKITSIINNPNIGLDNTNSNTALNADTNRFTFP